MNAVKTKKMLIVALDFKRKELKEGGLDMIRRTVDELYDHVDVFKVGLQVITAFGGPQVVKVVQEAGGKVMFDGKFYDIGNTMEAAVQEVVDLGVRSFTFHACNGDAVLKTVALEQGKVTSLGVTVLTSIEKEECIQIFGDNPAQKVMQFAKKVKESGCRGVVCSPEELKSLWLEEDLQGLELVAPGSRPTWAPLDDQKRVLTPGEAISCGATALVLGRPIMRPPEKIGTKVEATKRIRDEMEEAAAKMSND